MRTIEAYQCSDGLIYDDEDKAKAHDDDLLGQELDGLLRLFELQLPRSQEYKSLLCVMKKRKELLSAVVLITAILEHGRE
jgi:hypothetical protein